jgi:hypothetical protein
MSVVKEAWLSGDGLTAPGPWQILQSVLGPTGCGIGLAAPAGTGGGAANSLILGAFSPAYCQSVPWQALLLQKLLLSLPPGLSTVWQFAHEASNLYRCSDSQVVLRCDSGSGTVGAIAMGGSV